MLHSLAPRVLKQHRGGQLDQTRKLTREAAPAVALTRTRPGFVWTSSSAVGSRTQVSKFVELLRLLRVGLAAENLGNGMADLITNTQLGLECKFGQQRLCESYKGVKF